jgi:PEGA domain
MISRPYCFSQKRLTRALTVTTGDHTITVKKTGFTSWERTIKVSSGKVQISAELQASEGAQVQPAQ